MSQSIKCLPDSRLELWDENYRGGDVPLIICFEKFPKLPFKALEEYMSVSGFSMVYIVDADNNCWSNTASGGWLYPTLYELILDDMEDKYKKKLRVVLELEDVIPEWVNIAKRYGWNPPMFWRDEDALKAPTKK
jgi:hypothetical protein